MRPQRLIERLWWSDRAVRIFDVGSWVALVGAFCLYRWGGASVTPFVVVAAAKIGIGVWLWSDRLAGYDRRRQERLARRPPRRYLYPMVVIGFVAGGVLGELLGWSGLACGVVVAVLVDTAVEHWHRRPDADRSPVSP
jgi:hypothetical protein